MKKIKKENLRWWISVPGFEGTGKTNVGEKWIKIYIFKHIVFLWMAEEVWAALADVWREGCKMQRCHRRSTEGQEGEVMEANYSARNLKCDPINLSTPLTNTRRENIWNKTHYTPVKTQVGIFAASALSYLSIWKFSSIKAKWLNVTCSELGQRTELRGSNDQTTHTDYTSSHA